jgi:hypothetical protein
MAINQINWLRCFNKFLFKKNTSNRTVFNINFIHPKCVNGTVSKRLDQGIRANITGAY